MLNIKQAKPGVSGPDATRAALQGSRESPRVYMAGLGWGGGRGAKLRMLSAKYPHCLNHRGLGSGEVLVRGQFLRHLFCRLTGEVFPLLTSPVPGASPEYLFLLLGGQNQLEPELLKA